MFGALSNTDFYTRSCSGADTKGRLSPFPNLWLTLVHCLASLCKSQGTRRRNHTGPTNSPHELSDKLLLENDNLTLAIKLAIQAESVLQCAASLSPEQ